MTADIIKSIRQSITTDSNRFAVEQAAAQVASIAELVQAVQTAAEANDHEARETAVEAIHGDALSVEVRSGWYTPGQRDADTAPAEFNILLCTGGPACRIFGEVDEHGSVRGVRVQFQDWGTPWTDYPLTDDETEAVEFYAGEFYFGE